MAVKPYRTEEEERAYRYGKNSAALRAEEEKAFRAGKSDAYFQAKAMPLPQIAPKTIPLPQVKTQNVAVPKISAPQTKITMPQFNPIDLDSAKRNQLALTANPNASIEDIRRSMDVYRAAKAAPLDAEIAKYKQAYPDAKDWEANLAGRLNNSRLLNQAQNLMEATNPVASVYRTEKALSDIANKAIHGKTADEPYDIGAAYIRKADEAREDFRNESRSKALADVALAAGDMVSAAATGGTLGMGLTPYLATTGGIQTAGEDIERGKGLLPSVLHGVGSGGLTYLVEGLGGIGKTKYGQELLEEIASVPVISKALDAASPQVAKFLGNSLGRVLASAGQEGLEEGIEYPLQVMLENIIFDDATPFSVKEWWNNIVVGGGVGALFGGSNVMANRLAQTKQNPANSQTIENLSGGVDKSEAKATSAELLGKLRNSIPQIKQMQPVAQITGNEFEKGTLNLVQQVGAFFRKLGNKVNRAGLGDVILDERSVKDSIGHGIGRRKAAAFAAVPSVIRYGAEIDAQANWKGRGYDTVVFAAPISVGEMDAQAETNYIAVVVEKNIEENRYYLHEVLDQDGNIIYSKKREAGDVKTDSVSLENNESIGSPASQLNFTVPQAESEVKPSIRQTAPNMLAPLEQSMKQTAAQRKAPAENMAKAVEKLGRQMRGEAEPIPDSIARIGEAGAFDDVKIMLDNAERGQKKRQKAERDNPVTVATAEEVKRESKITPQSLASSLYRKVVDSGERVDKIGKATGDDVIYPLFNNAKQARQTAQYNIGVSQTNIKGEKIGKSVQDIITPIKEKGDAYWQDFNDYVYHMHNIDSMTLEARAPMILASEIEKLEAQYPVLVGKSYEDVQELKKLKQHKAAAEAWLNVTNRLYSIKNKPVYGRDITAQDSANTAGQLLMKHPEFENLAAEVTGYYKNLMQNNVDAGLISDRERGILAQLYPNYVPVMTTKPKLLGKQDIHHAGVEDVHKRREGNEQKPLPIDEVMARKTLSTVAAQRRNLFGVRLLEQALSNRDLVGQDVQSVFETDAPFDIDTDENIELRNSFKVWVDGQAAEMAVSDALMEGINSIIPKQSDGNEFVEVLGKINDRFKRAVTSDNPFFAITNSIKDFQDAAFYTDQNMGEFFTNYGKAYKEMLTNGPMWQLYQAMGGTGSSYFTYGEGVNAPKEKGKLGKLAEKIEQANLLTEQAPRLSEFMSVIEKGGTGYENVQKALLAAADVTTNFGRSGEWGKTLNKGFVPFFNPAVQGADKFARNIKTRVEDEKWGKLLASFIIAGALPGLWNSLLWGDDEEYQTLTNSVKDNYYLIKGKEGIWFRLPKGRAIMPIMNLVERGIGAARGDDSRMSGYVDSTLQAIAPNNPMTDNLFAPLLINAQLFNKDAPGRTWYGGDIEPQRLQKLKPGQRYDESTDVISKAIGGVTNLSPKKINYLLDQYSGVYGDVMLPLLTPKAEGVPLINRFYTDAVTSNRLSGDFYDALDRSQQDFNTNYNPVDRAEYKVLNKASQELSDLYAEEREIQASDNENSYKREKSREIAQKRNELILEALEAAEMAREDAERTFANIPREIYYAAYAEQKKYTKSKDKKAAVDAVAKGLSREQRKKLYAEFNIAESVW